MEKEDEIKGSGNSINFGARIYDARLGRWLAVDPLYHKYPWFTPYGFAVDNPIYWIDPDGRDLYACNDADRKLVQSARSTAFVLLRYFLFNT